jgi:CheY-like chemotaxis protein
MSKILIVDDDPDIRDSLKILLNLDGHTVLEASDGEVALEKAKSEKPELVLTDALMPIKDGYSLAKDLRSNCETSATPIIMLTALDKEQDELKAFQDGVDDFISKPFKRAVLNARISKLLSRNTLHNPGQRTPECEKAGSAVEAKDRRTTGYEPLDAALGGGLPEGNNFLLVGPTGSGKSTFLRGFIRDGLKNNERSIVITLDDDPAMIRKSIGSALSRSLETYEADKLFCLVDAYNCNRGAVNSPERFSVNGPLELSQLAGVISDASKNIGQNINSKRGGRRIFDSISSLFTDFDLTSTHRFLNQLTRTSSSYGGIVSLFTLEAGSVTDQVLNNLKYVFDGILETGISEDKFLIRVTNMKWSKFSRDWVELAPVG